MSVITEDDVATASIELAKKRDRSVSERYSIVQLSSHRYLVVEVASWSDLTVSFDYEVDGRRQHQLPNVARYVPVTRPLKHDDAVRATWLLRNGADLPEHFQPKSE